MKLSQKKEKKKKKDHHKTTKLRIAPFTFGKTFPPFSEISFPLVYQINLCNDSYFDLNINNWKNILEESHPNRFLKLLTPLKRSPGATWIVHTSYWPSTTNLRHYTPKQNLMSLPLFKRHSLLPNKIAILVFLNLKFKINQQLFFNKCDPNLL